MRCYRLYHIGDILMNYVERTELGFVALLIKGRSYPGMALLPLNWTALSCQSIKLIGERHHHCVIHYELALADHVHELNAGNYGGGRVE